MPITIVLPQPGSKVGPGIGMSVSTDLIGPIEVGSHWQTRIQTDPEAIPAVLRQVSDATTPQRSIRIARREETALDLGAEVVEQDADVHITVELTSPRGDVLDSGTIAATWSPTTMLWQHVSQTAATSGGLTATQSQQLLDTERRTQVLGEPQDLTITTPSGPLAITLGQLFSRPTLDTLTLLELTNGPTCEPVRVDLALHNFATIVRVTTIDPDLRPRTPDEAWYFPDLAVLRLFRGSELYYRRGIHTPTFEEERSWEWSWLFTLPALILGGPFATTVAVDWRPGCCGQVFVRTLP